MAKKAAKKKAAAKKAAPKKKAAKKKKKATSHRVESRFATTSKGGRIRSTAFAISTGCF